MKGIYISADVEAAGPAPPKYSMLSFGMCVVGRKEICFYRELRPLTLDYQLDALRVGALHLECLPKNDRHDATRPEFDPLATLEALQQHGSDPANVMGEAARWVKGISGPHEPVLVTDIQPFDGMFLMSYFASFYDSACPIGYKGRNLDELNRGLRGSADARLQDLGLADNRERPHHALEDAQFQSTLAEPVLDRIDPEWRTRLSHLPR